MRIGFLILEKEEFKGLESKFEKKEFYENKTEVTHVFSRYNSAEEVAIRKIGERAKENGADIFLIEHTESSSSRDYFVKGTYYWI